EATNGSLVPPRGGRRNGLDARGTLDDVSAYWINTFREIRDQEKLDTYVALAGPAMRDGGGTFLARGTPAAAFEQGTTDRTTLIVFDSVEQAVAAYESPAYQEALAVLGDGAVRDIRIIEAV
ncbi:DUF1330 domain-containing protein, partial [Actinomycetospora sp. OC33-EN08]